MRLASLPDHLCYGKHQAYSHDPNTKTNAQNSWDRPPAPCAQPYITQRWKNVSQNTGARSSDQLEYSAQIASHQAYCHGWHNKTCAEDQMAIWLIWLIGKVVVVHYFAAHEAFQRKGGEHIQTEAETGNLDHEVALWREVVEDVAFREIAECEEAW